MNIVNIGSSVSGGICGSVLVKMIRILNDEFRFQIACFDDKPCFSVFLQLWLMAGCVVCGESSVEVSARVRG